MQEFPERASIEHPGRPERSSPAVGRFSLDPTPPSSATREPAGVSTVGYPAPPRLR